jgi:DivIVA domain-containing protein
LAALPPALLPAYAKPADVDHVRFSLGLRGYRMDQVDEVLDDLRDQIASKDGQLASKEAEIAARDAEIERLREQLRNNVLSATAEDRP